MVLCVFREVEPGSGILSSGGSRIFLKGAPTPKVGVLIYFFAENCLKRKEFGSQGECASLAPLGPTNAK